jgi:hypothetical protein
VSLGGVPRGVADALILGPHGETVPHVENVKLLTCWQVQASRGSQLSLQKSLKPLS